MAISGLERSGSSFPQQEIQGLQGSVASRGIGQEQSSLTPAAPNNAGPLPSAPSCMGRIKSWLGRFIQSIKNCCARLMLKFCGTRAVPPTPPRVIPAVLKAELKLFLGLVEDGLMSNEQLGAEFHQIPGAKEEIYPLLGLHVSQNLSGLVIDRREDILGALSYSIMRLELRELLSATTNEERNTKLKDSPNYVYLPLFALAGLSVLGSEERLDLGDESQLGRIILKLEEAGQLMSPFFTRAIELACSDGDIQIVIRDFIINAHSINIFSVEGATEAEMEVSLTIIKRLANILYPNQQDASADDVQPCPNQQGAPADDELIGLAQLFTFLESGSNQQDA